MKKPYITIVSGLPRSGTSMMMQLLTAGGLPALTDHIRKEDEDNPKGYFEFEPVKRTQQDSSWVPRAQGKVVKMVYSLLKDLPDDQTYKVIFMDRTISEVIASQKKMLTRSGRTGAAISDEKLAGLFQTDLDRFKKWIQRKDNFSILYIQHRALIESPRDQCDIIYDFLGQSLDPVAAAAVVDPSLYRNRNKTLERGVGE
jgi:hypothetical protein